MKEYERYRDAIIEMVGQLGAGEEKFLWQIYTILVRHMRKDGIKDMTTNDEKRLR